MARQRNGIAVVDDDPAVREALSEQLSAFGYRVDVFASAEAFLQAVAASEAACALVDIYLGDVTGIEMVRQMRASGFDLPVIFMTGSSDAAIRRRAMELGCIAYLQKPIPVSHLIAAIADAVGANPDFQK